MSKARRVLITGTSSGFGLLITKALLQKGDTVFATMRDVEGRNAGVAKEIQAATGQSQGEVHTLELDVTDDTSVEGAIKQALQIGGGLDVVINNAGVGVGGMAEAFSTEQYERIFDISWTSRFGLLSVSL